MVLIVGSSGFIGSNLKQYFITHNISFKECSLRLGVPLKIDDDIETVVYLVGKAHDTKNLTVKEEYLNVNVELALSFFYIYLQSKARKFIFVSSIKAVIDSSVTAIDEEFESKASSIYGKSKLIAEQRLQKLSKYSNKKLIILRPTMIHGPFNKGNLNILYKFVKSRLPYPFSGVQNKRSLLSIENFCFTIKGIHLDSYFKAGIYHLADDNPLSTLEIIEEMENVLGRKSLKFQVPLFLEKIAIFIGDMFGGIISQDKIDKLTSSLVISNEKIKKELNTELPLNSKEGLRMTILSFLNK